MRAAARANRSREAFRSAFARLPSGVCVVTARAGDMLAGMTMTSITPLTLSPPRFVLCFGDDSETFAVIRSGVRFTVNVLASDQRETAITFAGAGREKFADTKLAEVEGCPLLAHAHAVFLCTSESHMRVGDHIIVVALVEAALGGGGEPLLRHDRSYGTFVTGG
ncbi:flavin reductase family protein [Nonomuraea sp. NPDC048882]|uniref:flavin reductase family protein n=1 Tax=unclassified Nonomuraea TaxID=2593643 RepID=UPI0033E2A951